MGQDDVLRALESRSSEWVGTKRLAELTGLSVKAVNNNLIALRKHPPRGFEWKPRFNSPSVPDELVLVPGRQQLVYRLNKDIEMERI